MGRLRVAGRESQGPGRRRARNGAGVPRPLCRRLLTEAAWNYRFTPRIGYRAQRRQEGLPPPTRELAWKAQLRLSARFAKLRGRGVQINKVCVAVARELAGFVWAIAKTTSAQAYR